MAGIDYSNLDPKTVKLLTDIEKRSPENLKLQAINDIASMTQEIIGLMDDDKKTSTKTVADLGALLMDIRESLTTLSDKKDPETPDYAKPVVEAVSKLEKALTGALSSVDVKPVFKPNISVNAPQVNAPEVDLTGVEKVIKNDLSKAFTQAIKLIPKVDIPKTDFQPLLDAWEGIAAQLASIDTATRMKPLPGSMKVTNPDGSVIGSNVTLQVSDIEIGAVEIKDSATDTRATVGANGLYTEVRASALPTGAATSTKQDTGNTSLASLDTKLPAQGQALAAASTPVVLPAAQITTLTPPAAITNYANETGGNLAAIKTDVDKIPSQGQALSAASMPVVLPATQITTLTPPAAITGFATSTKQSDGSQKSQIVDGAGNVIGATSNALDINIKSGNPTSITANAGTNLNTSALALDATLTGGAQKAIARGAAKGTTVAGDITSNPIDANTQALHVDGSKVTQPVSGTFWQSTQPVSGPLTDTQLRATAVDIRINSSGNIAATGAQTTAQNETVFDRLKTSAAVSAWDSTLTVGSQIIAIRGDQANGLDVDVTRVGGNVTVVQPTGTNLHIVLDANSGVDIGKLTANQSVNVNQVGGTNVVTGGVAGMQAVGGNVANAVTATANPVPVGGVFTTTPATLTTGQTATSQFTAAQNLKNDLTTIAGTAPTTVGKLDVKGADGDVFVRQATAANLNATAAQGGTWTVQPGNTANTTPWLVTGDVDHDAVNTLKNVQIAGHASQPDTLPTKVSAAGDRVRAWMDLRGRQIVAKQKLITYRAVYRLAVNNAISSLTTTLTANTDKELATIYHAVGATKEVQLRKVVVYLSQSTVASDLNIELREISATTAPATGNPAITPRALNSADAAAEATCLALPTTAGSEAAVNSPIASQELHLGAASTGATATPLASPTAIVLWDSSQVDNDVKNPTMKAATAIGYGVWIRATGVSDVVRAVVEITFTEETP